MISRNAKLLFYLSLGPVMGINGWIYRHLRAPRAGASGVHLGPGQKTYLNGWINVDANCLTARCDVWADFRRPLPFHDDTIPAFYSHHVVEHLPDLRQHFHEVFRCLIPGGVYRVGGPDGDSAIAKFVAGDNAWFSDFPDVRASTGGRLDNYLLCRGEHLHILTIGFLTEMLLDAGFEAPVKCLPTKETRHPELFSECLAVEWESDYDFPHTLIVEARKPRPTALSD